MTNTIDFNGVKENLLAWFNPELLTINATIQVGVLLIACGIARALGKPLKQHFHEKIKTHQDMSYRMVDLLQSLISLIIPALSFILIFVAARIISISPLASDGSFLTITGKLLLAWIFIRLCTIFISNRFARSAFTFMIWGIAALSIFGVLSIITQSLGGIGFSLGKFEISALGVVKGVLALALMLYCAMAFATFVDARLQRTGMNGASRLLITKVLRIFLIVCALLISITTAGIDLSILAVFSGALGLGIGFGLQRGASNLFSGMMLLMDQSIKPGDIIEVPSPSRGETTFGWVKVMGGRHTEIITRDNKSFLIPNEQLITQQVVNWSHGDTLVRLEAKFHVHYDSDPHQVRAIAAEAAKKPTRVEANPAPVCHLYAFGDSSIDFVLRFWIRDAENGITNVRGEVMLAIWDAFKENGIKIPYPVRDIYIHKEPTLS